MLSHGSSEAGLRIGKVTRCQETTNDHQNCGSEVGHGVAEVREDVWHRKEPERRHVHPGGRGELCKWLSIMAVRRCTHQGKGNEVVMHSC